MKKNVLVEKLVASTDMIETFFGVVGDVLGWTGKWVGMVSLSGAMGVVFEILILLNSHSEPYFSSLSASRQNNLAMFAFIAGVMSMLTSYFVIKVAINSSKVAKTENGTCVSVSSETDRTD